MKNFFKNLDLKKINFKNIDFKKDNVKKIIIAFFLVIALVIQFSFLSYLFKAIMPESDKNKENVIMSYTQSGNFDYRVYLKPNEFINNEYLESDEAYILDLIDHIQISSLYNFNSTTKTKVTGTDKLVARLKVYYKESTDKNENPEVMTKEDTLSEKVITFNDDKYNSVNTYDLYLDDYIQTLEEFQSRVKISVDGYLEIALVEDLSGSVGGASYNGDYETTLTIPLSNSVVQIENPKTDDKTEDIYEGDLLKTNKTVMAYVVIANIITFIIICLLLRKLFMFTNKNEYDRTLNKILKDYDDIIVNTTTILEVNKYKLIEIEEFKEILNLSRELLLPIMNYEVIKGKETWFYVIKDDILYRYVVSLDKLEKKKYEKQRSKNKDNEKDENQASNN